MTAEWVDTRLARTTIHDAVVAAVRAHLDENQITQKDLAAALDCRDTYIANILSTRDVTAGGRATLRSLQRVLDVLGLDVKVELIEREPSS